jgi:DNA-binding transcriptional regulator YiaG
MAKVVFKETARKTVESNSIASDKLRKEVVKKVNAKINRALPPQRKHYTCSENFKLNVGGMLKQLREQEGLSLRQFRELSGFQCHTVSRWEQGKDIPKLSVLEKFASVYNCEINITFNEAKRSNERS